ncbi:MAG: GNAT family N-acetyltransferase [Chloroflexi bacterium]|nr:GNAT family N-acetyltransferase [Chloroflexota bacterium]
MTTETQVRIVEARREHAGFIAWTMLTAARSHLDVGMWDLVTGWPEAETLRYLEALCTTERLHFTHYSLYLVAEVDGKPAAALSGYVESENGTHTLIEAMQEVDRKLGRSEAEFAAGWMRAGSIANVNPPHDPANWVVEHVATHPDFRRQGLIDRLLAAIVERGRERGATTADVGVLMGNDRAQAAYEKAGFSVVWEAEDEAFASAYKCPGIRLLRRAV